MQRGTTPLLERRSSRLPKKREPVLPTMLIYRQCQKVAKRAPLALVVALGAFFVFKSCPDQFTKIGKFGASDLPLGRVESVASITLLPGKEKAIVSLFSSMMPGAAVRNLLVAVVSTSSDKIGVKGIIYDHEGFYLRSGPVVPLPYRQNVPGAQWVTLPLEERLVTHHGLKGRGEMFFLGVHIVTDSDTVENVSFAVVNFEMFKLHSLAPRLATHFVMNDAGNVTHINFNRYEKNKQEVKEWPDYYDFGGFLGVQAQWFIERPTWAACYVVGVTVYMVILISNGVPACFAIAGAVVLFLMSGVLTVQQAVGGLAQEGILTVAIFLVVARALDDISYVEESIMWMIGKPSSLRRAHLQMTLPVAIMSAVVPNSAIIAIMIPILQRWASRLGINPAQFMMPCSFASLLGSNLTLIGSAANLIAASIFSDVVEIRMFDLAPNGIIIMIVGLIYIILAAPAILDSTVDFASSPEFGRQYSPNSSLSEGETDRDVVAAQGQIPIPSHEAGKIAAWQMPIAYKLSMSGSTNCLAPAVPTIEVISGGIFHVEKDVPRGRSRNGDDNVPARRRKSRTLTPDFTGGKPKWGNSANSFGDFRCDDEDNDIAILEQQRDTNDKNRISHAKARLYAVQFRCETNGVLVGSGLKTTGLQRVEGANLFEVRDPNGIFVYPRSPFDDEDYCLQGGEVLHFRVTPAGYHNLRCFRGLLQPAELSSWLTILGLGRRQRTLVEAVVQNVSCSLFDEDQTIDNEAILEELSAVVVGVRRGAGKDNTRTDAVVRHGFENYDGVKVEPGDVLLLDAREMGRRIEGRDEFFLVRTIQNTSPPRAGGLGDPPRAVLGISLLMGLLVLTSIPSLQVDPLVGAWIVAGLYILFDLLNFDQVLETLNARLPALLTLMMAIGVGEAFKESGLVDLLSSMVLSLAQWLEGFLGTQTRGISAAIFLVVCNLAAFVNMGSAVAIMAPVVQQLVVDMPGVELKPIAFILMNAANSPFATPFGATANLMVVASGKYSFMDFMRFGAPLQLLVMVTSLIANEMFTPAPVPAT